MSCDEKAEGVFIFLVDCDRVVMKKLRVYSYLSGSWLSCDEKDEGVFIFVVYCG